MPLMQAQTSEEACNSMRRCPATASTATVPLGGADEVKVRPLLSPRGLALQTGGGAWLFKQGEGGVDGDADVHL